MRAVVLVTASAIVCSIVAWTTDIPAAASVEQRADQGGPPSATRDTALLASSAAHLRLYDPFRLDRKPADVRYNPWEPVVASTPAAAPIRPALALAGLLGGPPWNALLEGVPGNESGVLLELGDSASGIRFVALRGDTVLLAGFDTTWSLTARRAWR